MRLSMKLASAIVALGLAPGAAVYAQNPGTAPTEAAIKAAAPASSEDSAAVESRFKERFPVIAVSEVSATPFPGIYEIRIGMDLLYADAQVDFLMQGALIYAQSRRDLTAERL